MFIPVINLSCSKFSALLLKKCKYSKGPLVDKSKFDDNATLITEVVD